MNAPIFHLVTFQMLCLFWGGGVHPCNKNNSYLKPSNSLNRQYHAIKSQPVIFFSSRLLLVVGCWLWLCLLFVFVVVVVVVVGCWLLVVGCCFPNK